MTRDASPGHGAGRAQQYKAASGSALETLRRGDFDEILELVHSPWPRIRMMAIRNIREKGLVAALPELLDRARIEEDDSVRRAIALALAELPDPRSSETLWNWLDDRSDDVRRTALRGLSRLKDDRIVPVALSWYESGEYVLRSEAVYALCSLRTAAGKQAFDELLAAERSWRRRRFLRKVERLAHDRS